MMRPETEAQLIEAVRGARTPLAITGGGTRTMGSPCGQPLQTAGLAGITLYDPGALTLVARAGTPLDTVEAALAAEGQRLAFEPPRLGAVLGRAGQSTLGGVVAANASGPRRVQAGACRDSLIGVAFVDGTGTLIRNGGRVMKNVTGYDLVKLLAGSQGSLGVLTELSFKLLPRPQTEASLLLDGLDPAQASRAMTRALATPFEVSGAAMLPATAAGFGPGHHRVVLRLEGFAAQVEGRLPRLATQLAGFGTATLLDDPAASAALWRDIRDLAPLASLLRPTLPHASDAGAEPAVAETAAAPDGSTQLWRVSIRPSRMPALLTKVAGCDAAVLADWGGGLVWLAGSHPDLAARVRGFVAAEGGHATRLLGQCPTTPAFQPEPPALARLAAALRAQFDPRGLFNPGLMG